MIAYQLGFAIIILTALASSYSHDLQAHGRQLCGVYVADFPFRERRGIIASGRN